MVSELDSAQRGQGLFAKLGGGGGVTLRWTGILSKGDKLYLCVKCQLIRSNG